MGLRRRRPARKGEVARYEDLIFNVLFFIVEKDRPLGSASPSVLKLEDEGGRKHEDKGGRKHEDKGVRGHEDEGVRGNLKNLFDISPPRLTQSRSGSLLPLSGSPKRFTISQNYIHTF